MELPACAIAFRIEQFREAGIFLQKSEVFIVARVIAILGPQFDGELEVLHGGFRFAGEAIEGGHGVNDEIGFGGEFARAAQVFARLVPAAVVHHRDTVLIMVVGGAQRGSGHAADALLTNAEMDLGALGQFLARRGDHFLEKFLGLVIFLLLEVALRLFVEFQLLLNARINQIDGRGARSQLLLKWLFFQ